MDSSLAVTTLPLDTPDDDPRWRGWQQQIQLGFLDPGIPDEFLSLYRTWARSDAHRLRGVLDPAAGLAKTPVATFTSVDKQLNVGAGRLVSADLISDVTVRASHRRRGLLRELMTLDLTEARDRGCVLAALTASEGGIYGRFGFGISSRAARVEIDCTRFRLRRPVPGRVEFVRPQDLGADYDRLADAALRHDRGAFTSWPHLRAMATGEFGWKSKGRNDRLLGIVHRDAAGQIDGLATFEPVADSDPGRLDVQQLLATAPEVEFALWEFLASIDLVERLGYAGARVDEPLQAALVDPRALRYQKVYDMLWIRVLDAPRALAERGWDHDGELVLRVVDPMGLAAGTWRVEVHSGRADVAATDAAPDATVDIDTLGSLYLGGVAPSSLAAAGRIDGDAAAVARLFSVDVAPHTPRGF